MTRTSVPLSKHLLTRADLSALGVPAQRILDWIAKGWIEQIGSFPTADPVGNAVFAVSAADLREELARALAADGRESIVFTPAHVRSLFARAAALLPPAGVVAAAGTAAGPEPAAPGSIDAAAELAALVARVAAADLDPESLTAMAREEALEELEEAAAKAERCEPAVQPGQLGSSAQAKAAPADDAPDVECFDAGDLTNELAAWNGDAEERATPGRTDAAAAPTSTTSPSATAGGTARRETPRPVAVAVAGAELDELIGAPPSPATTQTPVSAPRAFTPAPATETAAETAPATAVATPAATATPDVVRHEAKAAAPPPPPPASASAPVDPVVTAPAAPAAATASPECGAQAHAKPEPNPLADPAVLEEFRSSLAGIERALVETVQALQSPAPGVRQVIDMMQRGFMESARQGSASMHAIRCLGRELEAIVKHLRAGSAPPLPASAKGRTAGAQPEPTPRGVLRRFADIKAVAEVVRRAKALGARAASRLGVGRSNAILFASAALLICWTFVAWIRTGNASLMLGTLVGFGVIGYCALDARRA
jgi:hypothetical protein